MKIHPTYRGPITCYNSIFITGDGMPTLEEASDLEAGRGGDRMVGRPRRLLFLLFVVQMIHGTNGIFIPTHLP